MCDFSHIQTILIKLSGFHNAEFIMKTRTLTDEIMTSSVNKEVKLSDQSGRWRLHREKHVSEDPLRKAS